MCVAGVAHGIRCYKCGQYNEGVGSITPCINYTSHMLMECSSSDEWCIVSTTYILLFNSIYRIKRLEIYSVEYDCDCQRILRNAAKYRQENKNHILRPYGPKLQRRRNIRAAGNERACRIQVLLIFCEKINISFAKIGVGAAPTIT